MEILLTRLLSALKIFFATLFKKISESGYGCVTRTSSEHEYYSIFTGNKICQTLLND